MINNSIYQKPPNKIINSITTLLLETNSSVAENRIGICFPWWWWNTSACTEQLEMGIRDWKCRWKTTLWAGVVYGQQPRIKGILFFFSNLQSMLCLNSWDVLYVILCDFWEEFLLFLVCFYLWMGFIETITWNLHFKLFSNNEMTKTSK